jgi:hypothetical protein
MDVAWSKMLTNLSTLQLLPLDGLVGGLLNTLSILDLEEKKGKIFESSPLFPGVNIATGLHLLLAP